MRTDRAILLHAMGGMGKTALAREAGDWLTRTGLFPDGACFLSFEQPVTAERIAQVLGSYLEGHGFEALSQAEQLERARQLFQEQDVLMVWDNFESLLETFDNAAQGSRPVQDGVRRVVRRHPRDCTRDIPPRNARGLSRSSATGPRTRRVTAACSSPAVRGKRACRGCGEWSWPVWLAQTVCICWPRCCANTTRRWMTTRFDKDNLGALLDVLGDHPLSIELVGPHLKQLTPEQIVAHFRELLDQFTGDAEVERNRSLLASLRFSTSRLSAQAKAASAVARPVPGWRV